MPGTLPLDRGVGNYAIVLREVGANVAASAGEQAEEVLRDKMVAVPLL